jgi:hypothetical protein
MMTEESATAGIPYILVQHVDGVRTDDLTLFEQVLEVDARFVSQLAGFGMRNFTEAVEIQSQLDLNASCPIG